MAALLIRAAAAETRMSTFAVRIEVGAHEIVGDEPDSAGGLGLGPAPFDLLTAALAECTAMTVRWYAAQHQWPLDHVEVVVDYAKKQSPGASDPIDTFFEDDLSALSVWRR